MSEAYEPGPRPVTPPSTDRVPCMDAESAFLYLAGEMKSRAADVTAVHLVECAQCRDLVEEVSGIIGSSRELLQLAHHGGLDTEPPSLDVLMARGTALLRARRAEAGSPGVRLRLLKPTARMTGTLAASLCLAAGLAGLLWWTRSDISAAELLREANAAQASARPAPDSAVRRVLELEERRHSDGRLLTRQTVEIWESPATRRKARRLYTDGNVLLAGEWTRPLAPNLVAGRGLEPQVQSGPPAPDAADVWRWEPSVAHFELLARDLPTLEAEKTPHEYVITARGESSRGPALVRLILTRPGLRPVEQRIVFKRGDKADDFVEYRIIESDSRTVPLASMAAGVFEPNPELLPAVDAPSERPGRAAMPPAFVEPALADAEADALELEVTYRLHRLENCVRGEPTINRGARRIGVSVAVETDACRVEARRHFESLEGRRQIDLTLVQQRSRPEGRPAGNGQAPAVLGTALHTAFASHLRGANGPGRPDADIAEAATGLSQWIVDRSRHALEEARAIESLITTWDVPRLWSLDVDSRAKWQGILRDHARSLGSDAESLRVQMERTLPRPASETPFDAVISDLADVPRATVELTRLAEAQHRIVVQLLSPADAVPNAAELMRELVTTLATLARGADQFLEPWSLTTRGERE